MTGEKTVPLILEAAELWAMYQVIPGWDTYAGEKYQSYDLHRKIGDGLTTINEDKADFAVIEMTQEQLDLLTMVTAPGLAIFNHVVGISILHKVFRGQKDMEFPFPFLPTEPPLTHYHRRMRPQRGSHVGPSPT